MKLALLLGALAAIATGAPSSAAALSFTGPTNYATGNSPVSVQMGHFNGDSDPDLAVANEFSNDVSVLLGGAGETFSAAGNLPVGTGPQGIALGDFNGDSDPDLAVVNEFTYDVSVLLGGTGGSFSAATNFAVGTRPLAIAADDFNGDSDPDLAVVNESDNNVSVLLGDAGGSFTPGGLLPVGFTPQAVATGDFNGDSDPDLAIANGGSNTVSILLGGAGASFDLPLSFATGFFPISIAVAEFNGDSDPDLAIANEAGNDLSVLLGGTGGTFSAAGNVLTGTGPQTVEVGNFNTDSDPDLAVANELSGDVHVLLGGASGTFIGAGSFPTGVLPASVAIGKFDGDSHDDLAVANQGANTISILIKAVDSTPPETTIDPAPAGLINDSTPTFTFSSSELASTFRCRVDSGTFATCSSPHTTAVLSDGAHTFEVRATDDSGNTDATPASRAITVDTVAPPAPTLTGTTPASGTNENSPKVKGNAQAGTTVQLYSAVTIGECTPASLLASDTAAVFASPGIPIAVGDNTTTVVRATATDAAGNSSPCTNSINYIEASPPGSGGSPGGGTPGGGGSPPGGATKPPAGGAADRSAPTMALAAKAVKMQTGGVVVVKLSCPASEAGGCAGSLLLETRPTGKRKVALGKSSFRIPGAKSARVKVRLSKKSQRLVRTLKKLSVYAVVNARDASGNARTTKSRLTLRAAKP
jgi:hypothetical protein